MRYLLVSMVVGMGLLRGATTFAFDFSFGYQRNGTTAIKSLKKINITGVKDGDKKDDLLDVIKGIANWVFGILALIALLFLLYGGFLILTTGEDGYKKGLSIVRAALIGIVIIGVAWFFVSLVIRLSQQIGNATEGSSAGTDS